MSTNTTKIFLLIILILAIASMFCCNDVIVRGGTAIGNQMFGMSVGDRRVLDTEYSDMVMDRIRDPIKGGENPQLFDDMLDYGSSYYPAKRFPPIAQFD